MGYYIHSVPGRLRVKSPLVKGNRRAAEEIEKLLGSVQGVDSVLVNTVTGSVTVSCERNSAVSDSVLERLAASGYFEPSRAVTHDQYIQRAASKAGRLIGKSIAGAFIGAAFEGTALSILTILI
ncbi:MAG: hypothetical protein M0Z58_06945 [Nitrospiraceae bacterium]|nr:hypothetical protein [Nitrospiraceae bacterium]